jgi:Protein of unknown function (DUF1501)
MNHISLTRRRLVQVGGLGMLGLSLPGFLRASAPQSGSRPQREKSCILIVQGGGPSQLDTWDMKPNAPAEYRGPYKPIPTAVPGFQVCELMPRLARLADRTCIIRSMTHSNGEHGSAMHAFLAGHASPAADAPYFGTVMAKLQPSTRNVPSYVWLQDLEGDSGVGSRYQTGGFLGAAHAPLRVGLGADNPSNPNFQVRAFDGPKDVPAERIRDRQDLLGRLDPAATSLVQTPAGQAISRLREKAFAMIAGPEARQAFDINQEPAKLRERYGQHYLGQNLLMARRLVEAGVRLVSVTAFCGPSPYPSEVKYGVVANMWDMHGNGGNIFGKGWNGLGWALPCFDEAVSALLEDLEQRGLLDTTLVLALGEMGRTPKIATRSPVVSGRDHWPYCYPALLAGGGIRGGQVYGSSDRMAAYPRDNPVSPQDFSATVFHALGVAPETRLGADGFSRPVSLGRPIVDLV